MIRWVTAIVVVVFAFAPVQAADWDGKTILDSWDVIYLEGGRAGYINTTVVELDRKGPKTLRTTIDMHFIVKRFKQVVRLERQSGTDETPEGQVVATFMRQVLGTNKEQVIVGHVKGKQLELMLDGKTDGIKPAPWKDGVLGLYRQQTLFADKKVKSGDNFKFLTFEPSVNLVVEVNVAVKGREEVALLGKTKAKLLRVEVQSEKLEGVPMPMLVTWLNDELQPMRQDTEIPGLGKMSFFRTTREVALMAPADTTLTDIGIAQFIRLNKVVLKPYETTSAVYRITVRGDDDAAAAFAKDERQSVLKANGQRFEMQVKSVKGPKKGKGDTGRMAGDEFTQSSYFITSADPKVKELARKAVGKEVDPWKKALLIEKWVNKNMRATSGEEFAPADHVARNLEGDCTEYAMLMAAMCRAEGVPSKTAIGLVYADTKNGPVMAFHMWTEVWIAGQWVPLDATLGKGFVGATHLKVTDHSWHETRSLTPLLPLIRVLGKMQVEVISAN